MTAYMTIALGSVHWTIVLPSTLCLQHPMDEAVSFSSSSVCRSVGVCVYAHALCVCVCVCVCDTLFMGMAVHVMYMML